MLDEKLIARIVEEVIARLEAGEAAGSGETGACEACRDITAKACRDITMLDHPQDAEALARMKKKTTARIGVGRAGPRLNTRTMLTLRADHAKARDAVFLDVPGELIEKLGLFTVQTKCAEKNQFLTRPDLGRQLSEEGARAVKERCAPNPDVQVFLADGLSSTAVEANAETILGLLLDALKDRGLTVGTPPGGGAGGGQGGVRAHRGAPGTGQRREHERLHRLQRPGGYARGPADRGIQHPQGRHLRCRGGGLHRRAD